MSIKDENIKRSSFLLYIDKKEIVENLTDEQAGKVFKAIYRYVDEKEEMELDPVSKIVFVMFKQLLDKDENRYLSIVERNRQNGLRGGRPKKEENPKNPVGYSGNPKEPKKANNNTNNNNNSNKNKEYYSNKILNDLFLEFLDLRKQLKAKNTERAINSLLKTLSEYDDDTKYKMIENSITNSWKGVFPLKENKKTKPIREEQVPDWFNKNISSNPMSEEQQKEIDEMFREFDNP